MGAGIAAHLAAAGLRTFLLDIVPKGTPADAPHAARSALALAALKALPKSRPPALMSEEALGRITPGNFEDDLEKAIGQSDLVIEAVVERLDIKQDLWGRVGKAAPSDCVLATNTSGIPIHQIASALSADAQKRFLGLHFFNPPRFMHLLEVIPGPETAPEVISDASRFCDVELGKGVVPCRDTPNFIGNRIGIAEMLLTFRAAQALGLTVEEVDFLNGPLLGRPKTGSFRLGDMVGLDIVGHVVKNLTHGLSTDKNALNYDPLHDLMQVPEIVERLTSAGRLGDKTGAGFYKKASGPGGQREILSVDLKSGEYRPRIEPDFPDLVQQSKLLELEARVGGVLASEGKAGEFLRQVLIPLFNYSAHLSGVICETPQQIDEAMRFGYGWQLGPFELMDAAGPAWVLEQVRAQNQEPAALLEELVKTEGEAGRFYGGTASRPTVFTQRGGVPLARPEGAIFLSDVRAGGVLFENKSASLLDLGDGVACLEFRSKANILDDGVVSLLAEAPERVASHGLTGLVVGNQADHFCRGANLMYIAGLIGQKNFDGVEAAVRALQDAFMNLRHGPLPVVVAPFGQTLGGGTEVCLHGDAIVAGADLFMGLVEAGVGVLPAGGGLKEIARRASVWAAEIPGQSPYEAVRRGFECVAMAKVSSSAFEAQKMGFLSPRDKIVFHKSRVLEQAKKKVLALVAEGYQPPDRNEPISVIGEPGGANLMMGVQLFEWGGYASAHDKLIGQKIVHVLSGGMRPRPGTTTAAHLLDLEREAFVSLCGEEKTFARIKHMLSTKKPLRN